MEITSVLLERHFKEQLLTWNISDDLCDDDQKKMNSNNKNSGCLIDFPNKLFYYLTACDYKVYHCPVTSITSKFKCLFILAAGRPRKESS